LEIEYADGSRDEIGTTRPGRSVPMAIREADLIMGEAVDGGGPS
jgi:hypothetical protein